MAMENIAIWRSASQLVSRFGESAECEAVQQAHAALTQGDQHRFRQWVEITNAVTCLLDKPLKPPVAY